MSDLFVSYKAEDRARVAPLVQALETDGISVWWDEHIGGGDEWRDTILRHLEAAKCVIVVWSKRSVGPHGTFVRDEATRALRRGTYLPVRIDKVEPPLGFGESQALDLHGWKGNRSDSRYQAVRSSVQKRLGIKPGEAHPHHRAGANRRTVLIGAGAAGTVAVAGAGAWFFTRPASAHGDSIAVLPFANLSGDPSQAYFSDGIAEELRSALSRIAGLKVVARTSSEAVRNEDAKTAAHNLGVGNILTGSVRRSPEMIRVSAQLVDGRQGFEKWSEVYDRPPVDALQIQTDIAAKVAEALSVRLGGDSQARIEEGGTSNPAAQDMLLKARGAYGGLDSAERIKDAIATADAAIALDPNYSDAWATKANLQMMLGGSFATTAAESHAWYERATASARRAIQLGPKSRLAYATLAQCLDQQLDRRGAQLQYLKMQSLPGEDAETLLSYAGFLSETLHPDEAMTLVHQAVAIDPLNPLCYSLKSLVLANARRFAEAESAARQLIGLTQGAPHARAKYANVLMLAGKNAEAERQFRELNNDDPIRLTAQAILAHRRGDAAKAGSSFDRLRAEAADAGYYQVAEVLAQFGRKDEAIDTLNKAYAARDSGLTGVLVDPLLDPLRSDPRFQVFVKKLDFPT